MTCWNCAASDKKARGFPVARPLPPPSVSRRSTPLLISRDPLTVAVSNLWQNIRYQRWHQTARNNSHVYITTSLSHCTTPQYATPCRKDDTAPAFLRSCGDPESVAPKDEPSSVISNTFDNQEKAREPLCASRTSQTERCRTSCQRVSSALRRLYRVSLCQSRTLSELFSFS